MRRPPHFQHHLGRRPKTRAPRGVTPTVRRRPTSRLRSSAEDAMRHQVWHSAIVANTLLAAACGDDGNPAQDASVADAAPDAQDHKRGTVVVIEDAAQN